jgi:predicted enzyme related to lactoylglutathione lyase
MITGRCLCGEVAWQLDGNVDLINGGFFPKKPDGPAQHPSVVIGVTDIRESMRKVTSAGGKVLGEPMDHPV